VCFRSLGGQVATYRDEVVGVIVRCSAPNSSSGTNSKTSFLGSDATRWGVKYEDVANLLYSHYNTHA
jgi:hypothetical protein